MARSAILGNGSLAVGIDESGLIHDFYYPYVGLENLNSSRIAPHYIGVWINGKFSWIHNSGWENSIVLQEDAMITNSRHENAELNVILHIETYVDCNNNALIRHVRIENTAKEQADVRIFFHQVFQISSEGRSDTALYVPDGHYILDYKGRCSLLIKAEFDDGVAFDQYAAGGYGVEGKEGTFKDAEDGELSMSSVEHAGVDSVLRLSTLLESGKSKSLHYWVIASDSQADARYINEAILSEGIHSRKRLQLQHWDKWLSPAKTHLQKLAPRYRKAVLTSLFTIKAHVDNRGGIIAACDSSIYNYNRDYYSYVWPRDGAFTVWPLIRLGIYEEAKKFFEYCRDIMAPKGYMMHKYQPDKAIGSTWHPLLHGRHSELAIQEDETALIVFMLGEYFEYSKDLEYIHSMYESMIKPMANFMSSYIDKRTGLPHATYDLWEQKFLSNTFSSGATYKALKTAAYLAQKLGQEKDSEKWLLCAEQMIKNVDMYFDTERRAFRKGFLIEESGDMTFDNTLDVSSLYSAFTFGYASNKEQILSTAKLIEETLLDVSPSGGTPRYEHDDYFKSPKPHMGNPWCVTTLWMAQYYNRISKSDITVHYIDWALKHALPSGMLSEQINPEDGSVVGVTPLVWSHAELINTILDLGV